MTLWRRRDSPGTAVVLRPLLDFVRTEAAVGVVIAALIAMVWANSPWSDSYDELWQTRLVVGIGSHGLDLELRTWINEGLMAVFFFVVGLEIKRELVEGELRNRRRAVVPAVAALGGMAVPALLFLAFNVSRSFAEGWGIPVATDIAMAVGVLSLLGDRVPSSLKLFMLALAIVDDIGAILVITVAYSADLRGVPLLVGAFLLVVIVGARRFGVRAVPVYLALGVGLWVALHDSGVHPTLAGVVLGVVTPTRPIRQRELVDAAVLSDISTPAAARETVTLARESVSVVEWLEHRLHPWSSFLIVPLFALANAGISVGGDRLSDAASSSITYGVVVGLVFGKLLGVGGHLARGPHTHRRAAAGRHVDGHHRHRRAGRHRLHRLDLRCRAGVPRRRRRAERGQDRHPGRVDDRRRPRHRRADDTFCPEQPTHNGRSVRTVGRSAIRRAFRRARSPAVTIVGWHASHEQVPPGDLLIAARRAEDVGFDAGMSSDHFSPWSARQGESGFAWSWLGAAMATTSLPFGVVNAPGQRYHPAIIAQAAATLADMFPGRLWVALGTGEASNEHITGGGWPDKARRTRRLGECVQVLRALFAGEEVTHHGEIVVDRAQLWTLPVTPPPLLGAAVSAETAAWVGGWADGLATVNQPHDALRRVLDAFRSGGGEGKPAYLQVNVSWAPTDDEALAIAHDQWRTNVFDPPVCWDLELVAHFDVVAATVRPEDVRARVLVSGDPAWHRDQLAELVALGFDGVWIHHVGRSQLPFLDVFGEHVVPTLRKVTS